MSQVDEFLNPKSMITPGIAGTLTMTITNAFSRQFDLPLTIQQVALIVSFLIGLLVFKKIDSNIFKNFLFYVVNSLIIFSVASGFNNLGNDETSSGQYQAPESTPYLSPENNPKPGRLPIERGSMINFLGKAYASEMNSPKI